MTQRQNQLLKTIIAQYIKTAEPVSSQWLAEHCNFSAEGLRLRGSDSRSGSAAGGDFSSATIRHEMTELTEQGFLSQPHTSAGRVPTEKAYHYYIENFIKEGGVKPTDQKKLKKIKVQKQSPDILMKEIGQQVAEISGELTILASDKNNFYYTGLSNLFSHPEFNQSNIQDISRTIDRIGGILAQMFDEAEDEPTILLGHENPFGEFCGTVLARLQFPGQRNPSIIGLLGPVRMDYERNLAIIHYLKNLLSE